MSFLGPRVMKTTILLVFLTSYNDNWLLGLSLILQRFVIKYFLPFLDDMIVAYLVGVVSKKDTVK